MAGSLSQLSHMPGPDNVGQRDAFQRVQAILIRGTDSFKARGANMNELIADFQFHLMQHYLRLNDRDSSWSRGKTIHSWIWGCFKKVSK